MNLSEETIRLSIFNRLALPPDPKTAAEFADLRVTGRTTVGRTYTLPFGSSADRGAPTRDVWQVIADSDGLTSDTGPELSGEEHIVYESKTGRVQVKLRLVRDKGRVREIRFERITKLKGKDPELENVLILNGEGAENLLRACLVAANVEIEDEDTLKVSKDLLELVLRDSDALDRIYEQDSRSLRALVENDVTADDIIAVSAKRETLRDFEGMLDAGGYGESDWQEFFEDNPWLLGVGLSSHLFVSYSDEKLERYVAGASEFSDGKRVYALLTTSGIIRSVVLAEIKKPDDPLVKSGVYRSGVFGPSDDLAGGISQVLQTVERARETVGRSAPVKDADGYETGEKVLLADPRAYLVIGSHDSLRRNGMVHEDRVRSFELFRRTVRQPEILTYDEVLARAKWAVERAATGVSADGDS